MNELTARTFRTTPTGKFNIAEREALALALIDMTGVADLSTSSKRLLLLPTVVNRREEGQRSTEIMTSYLKGYPLRENKRYAIQKQTKGFQQYFKAFVKNSVPQTNQTTGL
jgi:hypothetical protein